MTLNIENLKEWGLTFWSPLKNGIINDICGGVTGTKYTGIGQKGCRDGNNSTHFNGTSAGYIAYPANTPAFVIPNDKDCSIIFNIKFTDVARYDQIAGFTNDRFYYGWRIFKNSSILYWKGVNTNGGDLPLVNTVALNIDADRLYNIAFVKNKTNYKIYIDSDEVASSISSNSLVYTSTHYPVIGRNSVCGDYVSSFSGQMRDFMIFNQALSPAQIKALREATYVE